MKTGCKWCLQADHTIDACPKIAAFRVATQHGIADPMHDEDPQDAVMMRLIGYRVYAGQLLRELREAGHEPSEATKQLNPDRLFEAA